MLLNVSSSFSVFPIIGQYKISDVAMISFLLHEHYGRIVRLGGLIGRPDLLFVYDADEIEKVCRFRSHAGRIPNEYSCDGIGKTTFPPCLLQYRAIGNP